MDDREDKRQVKLSLDYRPYYCIITLHYLITFGIQSEYYTADILAVLFETHFIARCPIISGRSSQSTILRDAVRVYSYISSISYSSYNNSSIDDSRVAQLHCYSDKPASFLPGLASGHFISHPLRPRSREGGQWNSSLRISERHPSPTPSFSTDLSTVPPAASTPAFRPPPFLPRSLLSPLPRIHSLLISSSLVHRDGMYERGRERGASAAR